MPHSLAQSEERQAAARASASEQPDVVESKHKLKALMSDDISTVQVHGLTAVSGRQAVKGDLAVESFKCQLWKPASSVPDLEPDEAVMMVKQFDSMYVADSVAVMNLKGELLGYVPRRHISRFPHDTNFGHVYAINQDAASLWRLTVACRPSLAPLTVNSIPANLVPHACISEALDPREWENIETAAYQEAGFKCEVSGPVAQLQCHEVWRFFEAYRIMKLIGFLAAHPDVCLVKHLDPCCSSDDPQRQECLPILQYMNEWDLQEAEDYLQYTKELAQKRSSEGWTMDLSWLRQRGYTIPPKSQHLCAVGIPRRVESKTLTKDISDRRSQFVKGNCCFQ